MADALSGKVSLTEILDGCVRTFEQGAQLIVDVVDTKSPTAKCGAVDRFARKFINEVNGWLSQSTSDLSKETRAGMLEDFSQRVNETAAESKHRIFLKAMDRKGSSDGSSSDHDSTALTVGNSKFWQKRQAEFEKYGQRFRDLTAHWYVSNNLWWFQYGHSKEGILKPPKQPVQVFNALARKILIGCPEIRAEISTKTGPRVARSAEPWEAWLDFMRLRDWGFSVTSNVVCTEFEWDIGVKDGKPLLQLRRELGHQPGDEWTKVYKRTRNGGLRQLTAREVRGKTSNQLQKYYRWLQDGRIEHVFETCAHFCEELSSRALESETAGRNSDRAQSARSRNEKGGRPRAFAIFGEKVRELRGAMSQGTFSRSTKLSIDVIQRAEQNEATTRTIQVICKYARSRNFELAPNTLKKNLPPKTAKT